MQSRIRREFSAAPKGHINEKSSPIQNTDIPLVKDHVRQVRKSVKEDDVLMGTKRRVKKQGEASERYQSMPKEGENRGEKARLMQLENLAKKQSQYKTNQSESGTNRNDLFTEESRGQVIDVEAAEEDDIENMMKVDKQKQIEAQARQRSKQQSQRNERIYTDKKDLKSAVKQSLPKESEIQPPLSPETNSNEQQEEVANAIIKSDGSYQPSVDALTNTSRLLKDVCGFSLSDYKGRKESLYKKSNVSVYVGRTLSIPVRVSTPGSFVEFSIKRIGSEFDFAILAVPDKGYAVDIKVSNRGYLHPQKACASGLFYRILKSSVLVKIILLFQSLKTETSFLFHKLNARHYSGRCCEHPLYIAIQV